MGASEGRWPKWLLTKASRGTGGTGTVTTTGTADATPGAGPDAGWPPGAAELLVDLLTTFPQLARHDGRLDLLRQMDDHAGGRAGFVLDVREEFEARAHLRAIVRAVEAWPEPGAGLAALRDGLRDLAPHDRALPWLRLAVLGLTGTAPLSAGPALEIVRVLHAVAPPPTAAQLARHVPHGTPGTALLTGTETLPEILLRLSDRRGAPDPGPLLRFLAGLAADREPAAHPHLAPLRDLLASLGRATAEPEPDEGRLIVQIRVEAVDPEHVEDARYELRGAYYRQPTGGGPLRRLGSLPPSEPFRRSELAGAGSARMAAWAELTREVRGSAGGVRVEFLLPTTLLGHRAELWSAGATRTPLGHHHPVVVRSLERYADSWLDPAPWRRRWHHLCDDDPYPDALDRIAWPPLQPGPTAELTEWLVRQPELACLGLAVPYDRLAAGVRDAVHDALFTEGVPVMVWRRDDGDPHELVSALRRHPPARLRDLPETVHRCRRHGRTAGETDVSRNITLLWDDPDCVDADQDVPYAGMA